ncbi:MAG: biopolymer transporter ExbD [Pseudomonadota bacterium]
MRLRLVPKIACQREDKAHSGVNLTPMLDVVFIMLIFFIVTATFVVEHGLDANPPEPAEADRADQRNIVVRIDARNQVLLAGRYIEQRLLRPQLVRLHAETPEAGVVIDAHAFSTNEALVRVMDQARLAGIQKISLAER